MSAKEIISNRKRSRPITKQSIFKKNKLVITLLSIIIIIIVISAIIVLNPFKKEGTINDQSGTQTGKNPIAVFNTTMGTFKVELYKDIVLITAGNFVDLANSGYYDGVIFHRVIKNFMIQGGDPNGDGTGGHAFEYHEGYGNPDNPDSWVIPDEFSEELSNILGTISMANGGENTGGSQFFINVKDNTYLDFNKEPLEYKHAVFGKVIEGMDVVYKISEVKTNSKDKPLTDIIINSIDIENE